MPLDRRLVQSEVENGLPNERPRLATAIENCAFYDYDATRYMARREAENEWDFGGRPHLVTGLTRLAIDVLCEQQYAPGPSRSFAEIPADAAKLIEGTYECTQIDAVFQRAEQLSTLNDVAAIEVRCTNDPSDPVDLALWGGEEFAVFPDPDRPRMPACVVTIDRFNQQTRYRVYWPDVVETYLTKEYTQDRTSGGTLAYKVGQVENTYGCLPFVFVPYDHQVHQFWTVAPGHFVRRAERAINHRLSELDEQAGAYKPIGVMVDVAPEVNPVVRPGRFIRLVSASLVPTGGDFGGAGGATPDAKYIQAVIDFAGQWTHLHEMMGTTLQGARVPIAAVRMEQQGFASGIALMVEQAPLLTRALRRRSLYMRAEQQLLRLILAAAGAHYRKPGWQTAAQTARPTLAWPEAAIPIPDPAQNELDDWEIARGLTSRLMIAQRRRGFSRTQALDLIKQVAEDEKEVARLLPESDPGTGPGDGNGDGNGNGNGQGQDQGERDDDGSTRPPLGDDDTAGALTDGEAGDGY